MTTFLIIALTFIVIALAFSIARLKIRYQQNLRFSRKEINMLRDLHEGNLHVCELLQLKNERLEKRINQLVNRNASLSIN